MRKQFYDILSKYKLTAILTSALLTMAMLLILARVPLLAASEREGVTVMERNGVYNLADVQDLNDTAIRLLPGDTYYPETYLTQENAASSVPVKVDRYDELRADYLSQRFVLLMPDTDETYSFTLSLSGRHALRVYVNGHLAAQAGQPGTTKRSTEVWENNLTFHGTPVNGHMEIILHSAQFFHSKHGASLAKLSVRSAKATGIDLVTFDRTKGLLVSGALLCAGALLLGIFLVLSRTPATITFALACVVMAIREGLQTQAWVYFPLHGNVSFMLEYLSVVLLAILLSLYLGHYASGRFLKGVQITALAGSGAYGLLVLFGDSLLYTSLLPAYQLLVVGSIVFGVGGLLVQMRKPTREQSAALYGIAVFFLAAVRDIGMYSDVLGDSAKIPVSESAMLVFVLAQTVSLFLMNNRVLARAQAEGQKLAAEKAALESLNRMKTEFLGNVSHELKTPLTVMSGYAQTTKQMAERPEGPDGAEVSRRMTLISSEAERLSLMVGQILDVTRMEEGRMAMTKSPCYVDEIIHIAVETHYPMLNKNRNRLEIRIESGLPAVYADPSRISQVVVNLISNAVRFTNDGVITLSANRDASNILVCVADNGTGIEPTLRPRLFERYGKQKSSGGQDTGTGLGLYICRHIVEQHEGSIWIESEEHKGTSVFFTLPVSQN